MRIEDKSNKDIRPAIERPKRVKLTLSLTEEDRKRLEEMAYSDGVTMAGLIHRWIAEHARKA